MWYQTIRYTNTNNSDTKQISTPTQKNSGTKKKISTLTHKNSGTKKKKTGIPTQKTVVQKNQLHQPQKIVEEKSTLTQRIVVEKKNQVH